jgi:hypothetical protein
MMKKALNEIHPLRTAELQGLRERFREKMSLNKARQGVALALALMVVLIGGIITALTFDFVYRFAWISTEQRGIYVDHTTVLTVIQTKIAQIIEDNKAAGKTLHVPSLLKLYDLRDRNIDVQDEDKLTLRDLSFDRPGDDPDDFPWSESVQLSSEMGNGNQRAVVDVFDMHFNPEWVNYDVFKSDPAAMKDFPPIFNMKGTVGAGGYNPVGDHKGPGASTGVSSGADELPPNRYGAYLIRVRLYDHQDKLLRTAEEAFVQILSDDIP